MPPIINQTGSKIQDIAAPMRLQANWNPLKMTALLININYNVFEKSWKSEINYVKWGFQLSNYCLGDTFYFLIKYVCPA